MFFFTSTIKLAIGGTCKFAVFTKFLSIFDLFIKIFVKDTSKVRANRPDHLNAVPLERDGHINKELRKELLLGKKGAEPHGHEHMDLDPKELIKHMLKW